MNKSQVKKIKFYETAWDVWKAVEADGDVLENSFGKCQENMPQYTNTTGHIDKQSHMHTQVK